MPFVRVRRWTDQESADDEVYRVPRRLVAVVRKLVGAEDHQAALRLVESKGVRVPEEATINIALY